jgi:hypothetical protein
MNEHCHESLHQDEVWKSVELVYGILVKFLAQRLELVSEVANTLSHKSKLHHTPRNFRTKLQNLSSYETKPSSIFTHVSRLPLIPPSTKSQILSPPPHQKPFTMKTVSPNLFFHKHFNTNSPYFFAKTFPFNYRFLYRNYSFKDLSKLKLQTHENWPHLYIPSIQLNDLFHENLFIITV